ncbi:MAG TPA: hypothetical protein VLG92_04040 [Candidatus Saccharimonadia bacterium]|nr:hypothetical protein [Candidatus Saccharimonadia bacterium]
MKARREITVLRYVKNRLLGVLLLVIVLFGSCGLTFAAAGSIAQDYRTTDSGIAPGALVSLTSNKLVVLASTAKATLIGVATSQPALELSDSAANNVHVAVSGSAQVLVSDVNGTIKAGDRITVSPFNGVGMKATDPSIIVGIAQSGLQGTNLTNQKVTDKYGKASTIHIGLLPVTVGVTYYTAADQSGVSAFVPIFLQNLANTVSGKQVSPLRVLAGTASVMLGFLTIIIMLYTSIRGAMISLGRNPLAQSVIRKGLVDVGFTALGVLVIVSVVAYALLAT